MPECPEPRSCLTSAEGGASWRAAVDPFSLLSSNLRGWSTPARDGANAWGSRAPRAVALLRTLSPHIVGFQEFHANNLADLQPALPHHAYSLGLECDTKSYVPIFWDRRRFEPVSQGGFWLNRWQDRKAPDWDANNERSMTWVELVDRTVDRRVLCVNTHLDHRSETSRVCGAQLILDFLAEWPQEVPVVITGDFNASPYQPVRDLPSTPHVYGMFAEAGFMDAYRSATGIWPPPTTFHNYEGNRYVPDQYGTWYIDWPLTRNLRVVSAQVVRHDPDAEPVSDHYPVQAVVTYTDST